MVKVRCPDLLNHDCLIVGVTVIEIVCVNSP